MYQVNRITKGESNHEKIMAPGLGIAYAAISTIFSGTWPAIVNASDVKSKVHPAVLNMEFSFGFFLSSWIGLVSLNDSVYNFSVWGLLSAALFQLSVGLLTTLAFPILGISVSAGIASSTVVLTSFIWSIVFKDAMRSVGLAILGIVVALSGLILVLLSARVKDIPHEEALPLVGSINGSASMRLTIGVLSALFAGILGGSYLVPNASCCANDGVVFLPSFGIGMLCICPAISWLISAVCFATEENMSSFPTIVESIMKSTRIGILGGAICGFSIFFIMAVCLTFYSYLLMVL